MRLWVALSTAVYGTVVGAALGGTAYRAVVPKPECFSALTLPGPAACPGQTSTGLVVSVLCGIVVTLAVSFVVALSRRPSVTSAHH